MSESRQGVFSKEKSPYVEMSVSRSDPYSIVAKKAAEKCRLNYCKNKVLSLFKLNGVRILNESVNVNGKLKPWTLGSYIQMIKKSPKNVKIGVGYVARDATPILSDHSDFSHSENESLPGIKL